MEQGPPELRLDYGLASDARSRELVSSAAGKKGWPASRYFEGIWSLTYRRCGRRQFGVSYRQLRQCLNPDSPSNSTENDEIRRRGQTYAAHMALAKRGSVVISGFIPVRRC